LARRKKERQPRLGCYELSGLVRCGHCGGNMVARVNLAGVGGRKHTYRRILCGTYNRTGGPSCQYNAVDADALARAVVKKLQSRLFSPQALEALRAEVRRQDEEAAAGNGLLNALEARLATLDRSVERAARRVVEEEDEALVPALRKQLKAVQRERDELARQAEEARRSQQPNGDLEAGVEEAMAMAGRFNEALESGDGDLLRDVLGEAVSHVELFFDHSRTATGRRVRSTYSRGLIHTRPQRWAEYTQVNGPPAPCRKTTSGYFFAGS
jgi:hypothetical protein